MKGPQNNSNIPRTLYATQADRGIKTVLDVQIQGHRMQALLDSGAIGNYISPAIVNHYQLP
jgi:hypothetical protein